MKSLKILIDDLDKWSPYYPSDNTETIAKYSQDNIKVLCITIMLEFLNRMNLKKIPYGNF